MKNLFFKSVLALVFVAILCNYASAQHLLLQSQPQDKPQFSLRYLHPNFESDVHLSTLSGIYNLSANIPISSNLNIVASLPYSTYTDEDESDDDFGNLYVGLQMHQLSSSTNKSVYSVGVYLPTASDDTFANFVSMFANYHQFQKYGTIQF